MLNTEDFFRETSSLFQSTADMITEAAVARARAAQPDISEGLIDEIKCGEPIIDVRAVKCRDTSQVQGDRHGRCARAGGGVRARVAAADDGLRAGNGGAGA